VNEVREICIERVCDGIGSSERERLIEIPFHHQVMTAKPLFDIMRAIIAETVNAPTSPHYQDRTTIRKLLSHIETEYSGLHSKRNELIHGTWFVGYTSNDDPDAKEFVVRKYKTTSDGLTEAQSLPKNASELLDLARRCDETRTWLGHVDYCLQDKRPISEFFKKNGQDWKLFLTTESIGMTLPST
jgi:hypothetical protein